MLGYPEEMCDFDIENDIEICMNTCVFDIDEGLIVKVVEGKEVIRARKGFRELSKAEIESIYGSPPVL